MTTVTYDRTCGVDENGTPVHLYPNSRYWSCPQCGQGLCKVVGRRSATRVGGVNGDQAPLIRCNNCSYQSVISADILTWRKV